MQNNKTFYKRCSTREQAVDFAEKSQGTIQEDGCTVAFDAPTAYLRRCLM